jgi:hypothetical protein
MFFIRSNFGREKTWTIPTRESSLCEQRITYLVKMFCLLMNMKINYRAHNNKPPDISWYILSQMNTVHVPHTIFKIHINIIFSYFRTFPIKFYPYKFVYVPHLSVSVAYATNPIPLGLIAPIIVGGDQ